MYMYIYKDIYNIYIYICIYIYIYIYMYICICIYTSSIQALKYFNDPIHETYQKILNSA